MPPTPLDQLGEARTVLLTTFRKNGDPVPTPVWVVRSGDELLVWTNPRSGKYKRIRRNPAVTLVPCSFRGIPYGEPVRGTGRLLEGNEVAGVLAGIKVKYGLVGRWSILTSSIGNKVRGLPATTGLAITLD